MRKISLFLFLIVAVATATSSAGVAAARGATAAPVVHHQPASHPHPGVVTVPARRPAGVSPRVTAASTSYNWSGYVASGSSYTTVSASWIVTLPTCLSSGDGTEVAWVGLDGWTSSTVEQTGTAVDCTSGLPRFYAWWETYPANAIQEYSVPVYVDDVITATVTYTGGRYDLVLTDHTVGWTENNLVSGASGARNSSAEVITESTSSGGVVGHLPIYWVEPYTGATINGGSLAAAGAQAVNMLSSSGTVISSTAGYDGAGDFNTFYGSSTNPSTIYECAGGGYQSEFGYLLAAAGCTGPYGSATGGDIVSIASMSDIDQIDDGAYTVACEGSVGPLTNGNLNSGYCPSVFPA